jgi:zinc protease
MKRFALLLLVACGSAQKAQPLPVEAPPTATPAVAVAKPAPAEEPLTPLDPNIKKTVLPNGLTVYVMKHKKPEQRAQLWLAVNAGSVQEDDDQRGLAHFVEHMAFNGTKRFAKQAIINYIEKVGMRFGPDVNAYTSFDQTVYQLTVPTDDKTVMLTGLDILRDWAGDVTFDPQEVEKERGVVLEEWRLGRGAFARINDKQWPVMFKGSKYAERLPIGLPEILKKAPRDALVRYYKDWYRPENMAVMAVGDFDPAAMEKEIAARFGDLKGEGKARARDAVPVPRDHETLVSIETDPEMPFSQVEVITKMDHRPERTRADYRISILDSLYHTMLRARFSELALDPASPFTSAGSWTGDLTRTSEGFTRFANAKQGRTAEALAILFREIERVEQHGFTQAELDRARSSRLSDMETDAAEWEKSPSDAIADEMTRNFFEGEQMPGRPYELKMFRELFPTVTLAELNHLARTWGGEKGRVIQLSGPTKGKLPTEEEVRKIVADAASAKVEAWKDAPAKPLLAKAPAPGTIVETTEDKGAGATVWKLSNGIRVIVKPTTFQNDSIDISGWKLGGTSLVENVVDARFADDIVQAGGAGELDPVALKKALAGKVANINIYFSELSEGVYGSARPADIETALQLLHVKLTAPRKDERAFAAWRDDQLEWARNRRLLPEVSFYEDMEAIRSKNHPRRQPVTPEMLAKVDLNRSHDVWNKRFADLGGFTFIFVGNVDMTKLKPLVETYLASLPAKGKTDKWKDVGIKYATGKVNKTVVAGTEPKSYVSMTFGAADKWSREADRDARILSMVLRIRLREVLREDMGGVYGVRSYVWISRQPTTRREAGLQWGCDPQNVDKLRDAALGVVREVQKSGISEEYLEKVREQLKRARETDAKENWWWTNEIRTAYWFGEDLTDATNLDATLARVTSDNVKAAAKRFFDEKNLVIGVLKPKTVTATK